MGLLSLLAELLGADGGDRPRRFHRDPLDLSQPLGTAPRRPVHDLTGSGPLDGGRLLSMALREGDRYPSLLLPEDW